MWRYVPFLLNNLKNILTTLVVLTNVVVFGFSQSDNYANGNGRYNFNTQALIS
jgi:hypothetical protein